MFEIASSYFEILRNPSILPLHNSTLNKNEDLSTLDSGRDYREQATVKNNWNIRPLKEMFQWSSFSGSNSYFQWLKRNEYNLLYFKMNYSIAILFANAILA
jgi:hypothetical protein